MEAPLDTREEFSLIKRARSFTHAWRGIVVFIKTSHNAWVHLVILALAILLGIYFKITLTEWMMLVFAGGFVLTAEAFKYSNRN